MSTRPYDILVFIGRFQPFHRGHRSVVDHALNMADKVVVLVGSANVARSLRNPWTFQERAQLIVDHYYSSYDVNRLKILPLNDMLYNETDWIKQVHHLVAPFVPGNEFGVALHGTRDAKIGLIGAAKDHTSYYLKLFPEWDSIDSAYINPPLNATDIRNQFFGGINKDFGREVMELQTVRFLREFVNKPEFAALQAEMRFIANYKQQWANSPYPPIFSTVDAVVVQSGNVLLVRRKGFPGQGQLALPGGFIDPTETLQEAVLRELKEETRLKLPVPVLKGALKRREVFDNPERSSRGRTITNAFLFHLEDALELPKVKGGDDAASADWYPLGTLDPREMYEDHYAIIEHMTAGI